MTTASLRGIILLDTDLQPTCNIHGTQPVHLDSDRHATCDTCGASAWVGLRPLGHPDRARLT